MSTYSQLLYHIVFTTHNMSHTLHKKGRQELFAFIWVVLKNKRCHLYRVNGMEDHLHIFTHVPASITIGTLVDDIKLSSSKMIYENSLFKNFTGWQEGYGAFTIGYSSKNHLINYVKNQEAHHKKIGFIDEYKNILEEHGMIFDNKYLL